MSYHLSTLQHIIIEYAKTHYKFTYKSLKEHVHEKEKETGIKATDKQIKELLNYLISIDYIVEEKGNDKVHKMYLCHIGGI